MAKPWVHPADYDATPRPVVATGNEYPPSFDLDWRRHGRGQLLYAAACDIPADYDEAGRDGLVMDLLPAELARAPVIPLAVPFPALPALARRCHAFLERPTPHETSTTGAGSWALAARPSPAPSAARPA